MVAVLNKPPTVEEYEGTKPPTVAEYDPITPRPSTSSAADIYGAFDVWAAPSDSEIWKSPGADFVRGFGQGWMRQTQVPALMGKKLPPPTTRAEKIGEGAGRMMEAITELIGVGAVLRGAGMLSGAIPKGAWLGRALQTGFLFSTQQVTEEARKAVAEAIYDEDFGSRGGMAVMESFALGAVLSLAGSGIGSVWNRLKPTEQARALRTLGLKKGASLNEINKAARREAMKFHPDKVKGMREQFETVIKARDALRKTKAGDVIIASAKQSFRKQLMGKTGVSGEVADVAIKRLDAGESITKVEQMISQAKAGIKPLVTAPTIPEIAPVTQPEAVGVPPELEPLAQEARKAGSIEEFSKKLQEVKQWGKQRYRTKGFPQLSALPGEMERYQKWYDNLSSEKRTLEDLYESYRNIPNRGITISEFYKQAQPPTVAKPEAVEKPPSVAEYEAPIMATQAQKAQAHIIAEKKAFVSEKGKMRPGYRVLAKAMTGQTSIAKMTEQQATDFINALNKLPEPKVIGGKIIPPSIPRTTKLVPKGFAQRQFKRPTPISLITSNAYYAEKLGVKSLVEPLERAKMRFDLEHHSASNEIDRMGQKIDVLGKTTAKEKITAKVRNIPTRARAEMGDLLDSYEEAPADLSPKKKEIFDWFRNLTRTILKRQNEARAKLDLPLIKERKAYMRHVATDISREMLAGKYPFPEGVGFWSGLNVGKKIFNPMEFQRKLEDDVYGLFTRDPVYASKAMMYNALKEIHLNQPLKFFNEQLSALGKDLPEYKNLSPKERAELDKTSVIPADTRRWLIDYVRTVIKGQQTNTDMLVNNIVNESGLRGLLNTALRPFGRTLSQRPVTKFFQGAGRVQMAGVMGPRPRLLIRNKFQLTQNLALYGTKANIRAFLPPNKELKELLDESLFLKSYTGLEELPADLAKKVEKLWHTAYQWTASSNARQAMEVAYWDIKELIDNPKYKKYGWKPEHLLKEMEFGASATQYQYNAIGMPGIFRHKSLIPATRLTSWWMNYFAKFHREALHRAFTGRPSWSGPEGPTLPWSRRLGWLRYAVFGGLILNTMGYTRSFMFGAAPTGWPPALQAVSALYRYTIADTEEKRKAAKVRFFNAAKTFIPGYIAYKDFNAIWTGRKDLESLFFYEKRKKVKGD